MCNLFLELVCELAWCADPAAHQRNSFPAQIMCYYFSGAARYRFFAGITDNLLIKKKFFIKKNEKI